MLWIILLYFLDLNHKIRIEHQIEEVEGKVRIANECLFSATHSLSRCTAKLVDFISENDSFFINRIIASETLSATNSISFVSTAPAATQSLSSGEQSNPLNPALPSSIGLVAKQRQVTPNVQTIEQIRKQLALKQSELNLLWYQLKELGSGRDTGTEREKQDEKMGEAQISDDMDMTCSEGKELFYKDEAQLLYNRLSLSESMASQVAEERAKLKVINFMEKWFCIMLIAIYAQAMYCYMCCEIRGCLNNLGGKKKMLW